MSCRKEAQPKPSLVTAYDDLCRSSNSLITLDKNEYFQLIRNFEENRIQWLSAHRDLASMTDKYYELLQTNETREETKKHLKNSLANEIKIKNEYRRERDALRQQLDTIRKFVIEEPKVCTQNQNVVSYLNRERLDTLVENSHLNIYTNINKVIDSLKEPSKQNSLVTKRQCDHILEDNREHSLTNQVNRMHSFITKKAFKPQKCGPCGKRIGFCGDCYKCLDCFATCHMKCHDKMPLPCKPFTRQNVKGEETQIIADCVDGRVRPAIPVQIIRLCNEIEKRGLEEEGLYRIPGSYRVVNKIYRDMFVKRKNGLPSLRSSHVKVLCGVLKKFLMNLEEPIVTRILWRDFVDATVQKNLEDEQRLIKQAISELPTVNRDTLAFLMVHLQRIAKSDATKMDEKNIATVLGPTIIGHSAPNMPYRHLIAEFKSQSKVLESLLRMSENYWNSVLCTKQLLQTSTHSSPDKRLSIGTQFFGGTNVQTGILSPHRSAVKITEKNSQTKTNMKETKTKEYDEAMIYSLSTGRRTASGNISGVKRYSSDGVKHSKYF